MGQTNPPCKMSTSQLACTYAAIILHDDGMAVSADNIKALVSAAGCTVESYWPMLFAKALDGKDIDTLLTTIGAGGDGAGPAGGGGGGAAEEDAPKEEEKKESSSSSDEGGGGMGGMFDDY